MKPGVYITVDVECSMGGAWSSADLRPVSPARAMMGEYGEKRLGIPLICDILEDSGLTATFFVDPFAEEQAHPGKTGPVCEYLVERGQDVQLHIHPNHKHYGMKQQGQPHPFTDMMADLEPAWQRQLLEEGAERSERW